MYHLVVSQTQGNASIASTWLTSLFAPLLLAWNWVWFRFFSNHSPQVTQQVAPSQATTTSQQQPTSHGYDLFCIHLLVEITYQFIVTFFRVRRRRPDGNIHRLSDASPDDSSDDNATWNGNSTQQL